MDFTLYISVSVTSQKALVKISSMRAPSEQIALTGTLPTLSLDNIDLNSSLPFRKILTNSKALCHFLLSAFKNALELKWLLFFLNLLVLSLVLCCNHYYIFPSSL